MPKDIKSKKSSQQEIDDAIRDRGPFYIGARGTKSQTPSKEMYANQPEPNYWDMYGERGRVEAPLANVDIMGNVTGPEDTSKTYAMGGLTGQPTLNYMGAKKGGQVLAKGNKLAKHKITKLY